MRNNLITVALMLVSSFCGGAVASVLLEGRVSAQGPQALTASQVSLVDPDGVIRAILSARDERGLASLTFFDGDARPRGIVGVQPTGQPVVRLLNAAGEDRVSARVTGDDALLIVGDDRRTHGIFGSSSGIPVLSLADGPRGRAQFLLTPTGAPSLILSGQDGQRAASLTVDDRDTPVVTLYDGGRPRVTLGIVEQSAVLNMTGPSGARVVVGVAANDRPSVTILDQAGEVVGALP